MVKEAINGRFGLIVLCVNGLRCRCNGYLTDAAPTDTENGTSRAKLVLIPIQPNSVRNEHRDNAL